MDPVNLIGKPGLLKRYLSENNVSHLEKNELLLWALSVACKESSKELIKFGAYLASGKMSEVLISWDTDEIESDERQNLLSLLLESTQYKPTFEDQVNCGNHIILRLKLILESKEPKKLEYLSKIALRKLLIIQSDGKSIIQTIQKAHSWPRHFLYNVYDI